MPAIYPLNFTTEVVIHLKLVNPACQDDEFFSSGGFPLPLPRGANDHTLQRAMGADSSRCILSIPKPMRQAFGNMPEVCISMAATMKGTLPTPIRAARLGTYGEVQASDFHVPYRLMRDTRVHNDSKKSDWAKFLACAVDHWLKYKSESKLRSWMQELAEDQPAPPVLPSITSVPSKGKADAQARAVSATSAGVKCSFGTTEEVYDAVALAIKTSWAVLSERGRDFARSMGGKDLIDARWCQEVTMREGREHGVLDTGGAGIFTKSVKDDCCGTDSTKGWHHCTREAL